MEMGSRILIVYWARVPQLYGEWGWANCMFLTIFLPSRVWLYKIGGSNGSTRFWSIWLMDPTVLTLATQKGGEKGLRKTKTKGPESQGQQSALLIPTFFILL